MKESFDKLEKIINEIIGQIERRLSIEQLELNEYDDLIKNSLDDDNIIRDSMLKFREKIVFYKSNRSFWDKDIPNMIFLLDDAKEKIEAYQKGLKDIGGKDLPNNDIINLIQFGILSSETPISKTHKGKEIKGHLTKDGFLEIELNGTKMKKSLRKAAILAWGTNPPNQWTFWEATDKNGERRSLEYFKTLLSVKSNS